MHTQKLKHRAVHIFVFNKKGDLFLQKRSRWKDANPGRWDSSAAGHCSAGCDYDETAARELNEELGVSAPLTLVGTHQAGPETGWEFVRLYKAEHNGPFQWPRAEIENGLFFPIPLLERWTAARPLDFSKSFLASFRLWKEQRPE